MSSDKPLVITMGDPAGIGPETIVKLYSEVAAHVHLIPGFRGVVVGDVKRLDRANALVGAGLRIREVASVDECLFSAGAIEVLQEGECVDNLPFGELHKRAGQAAYDYVVRGIELCQSGATSGIVTAPINKAAMALAGIPYPGHTEILAKRSGVTDFAMMLANDEIRVVLATIHVALREVPDLLNLDVEMKAIRMAHNAGVALGFKHPRIAVAGLNPHAAEGGMFGLEESTIIAPAIAASRERGIDASGPWPGDTVFFSAREGEFDMVVAQYHDQGLIPVKYMGLFNGVNITLGLPFVRTSPDHGTAFDIAGTGVADPHSLLAAVQYAQRLIPGRAERPIQGN
ncbi:4-hydroxythreonine-4-phosphate dehydrogenase PdxA [Candidatus Bipolaricaulota bacterium]